MANTVIQLKKSNTPGKVPTSLSAGEIAINTADGILYYKDTVNNAVKPVITTVVSTVNSFSTVNANSSLLLASSPYSILTINGNNSIIVSGNPSTDYITIDIRNASTTDSGAVQLGDNVSSTSASIAATANSVYTAYNKALLSYQYASSTANNAYNTANAAWAGANNSYIYASSTANNAYITANAAWAKANAAFNSASANDKTYTFFQNTAPTSSNTRDQWINCDTGVMYENFGNSSSPVWAEVGPTSISPNTTPGMLVGSQVIVSYTPSITSGAGIQITAANTNGGIGYADFLKVTNSSGGATNPNKWFRVDSSGSFNIINSGYTSTLLGLTDSGALSVSNNMTIPGSANVTNNASTDHALNVGNHGQLFDDGNFHLHTSSGTLWLNSLDGGDIALGLQSNSGSSKVVANNMSLNAGYGSTAPIYGIRAWINCGWNGSSMVTRGAGNLSVSRGSTGVYNFTFGNSLPDGNYAVSATAQTPGTNSDCAVNITNGTTPSSTGFSLTVARYGNGNEDTAILHVQVVR